MKALKVFVLLMTAMLCLATVAIADNHETNEDIKEIDDEIKELMDEKQELLDEEHEEMVFVDEDGNEIPPPPMDENGNPLPPPNTEPIEFSDDPSKSDEDKAADGMPRGPPLDKGLDRAQERANEHAQERLEEVKEKVEEHRQEVFENFQERKEELGIKLSEHDLKQLKDDAAMCAIELGRKDDLIMGLELQLDELKSFIEENGLEVPELSEEAKDLMDTSEFEELVGKDLDEIKEEAESQLEEGEPQNLVRRFFGFFRGNGPQGEAPRGPPQANSPENSVEPMPEGEMLDDKAGVPEDEGIAVEK